MKPKRQKKAIVTEPLAAVKRRLRKRPTSSIGAEVRRSHITKAASRTVAIAKPPSVRALPHPWLGASMIVKISSPIAAVENTSPPRSIRGACGSRDVGTTEATKTAAAAATGAIAKKMLFQEKRSSSQPPAIGPRAIAAPAVAPQKPIALALPARAVGRHVSGHVHAPGRGRPVRPLPLRRTGAPDFDRSPVSISASPVRRQNEYGERRRHDHRRFDP